MRPELLSSDDILNIFTDASLLKHHNYSVVCPGAIAVTTDNKIIDSEFLVISDFTNNQGEIMAIKLGMEIAIRFQSKYRVINIISDSIISVRGLEEWIFTWYKNKKGNVLMSSSNKPVANQEIFIDVINKVLSIKVSRLCIYHTLGHMRYNSQSDLQQIINNFTAVNGKEISEEEAIYLAYFNDIIDKETRNQLLNISNNKEMMSIGRKGLIPEFPTENDICRYFSIINKEKEKDYYGKETEEQRGAAKHKTQTSECKA